MRGYENGSRTFLGSEWHIIYRGCYQKTRNCIGRGGGPNLERFGSQGRLPGLRIWLATQDLVHHRAIVEHLNGSLYVLVSLQLVLFTT